MRDSRLLERRICLVGALNLVNSPQTLVKMFITNVTFVISFWPISLNHARFRNPPVKSHRAPFTRKAVPSESHNGLPKKRQKTNKKILMSPAVVQFVKKKGLETAPSNEVHG